MTLLGQHTASELRDLVTDKDAQIAQVDAAYHAHENAVDASWKSDWDAMKTRYQAARDRASLALTIAKTSVVPDNLLAAEKEYQGILSALQRDPGRYTDQDWQGLYNRLTQAIGSAPPVVAVQPQSTDVDLAAYQGLDQATRDMPDWVKRGVATVAPGLVPKTADQPNYKPVSKWVWYAGGAAAVVTLLVAGKVALR